MYATAETHHTQLQKSDSYRAVRVVLLSLLQGNLLEQFKAPKLARQGCCC